MQVSAISMATINQHRPLFAKAQSAAGKDVPLRG